MSESVRFCVWLGSVAFALVLALFLFANSGFATMSPADRISGMARAVDGDTLDVGGERVRLEGIDAPEVAQTCPRAWIGTWPCGKSAQRELARIVDRAEVTCDRRGTDKYGRALGICYAHGKDINAAMVRSGLAWAFIKYSSTYAAEEAQARGQRVGIWQADSEPAWLYRERRWTSAEQVAPQGCAIKGNITGKGHIYHLPWSPWYAKVRVETAKGERWFCSETEAAAAGWRPALVN